MEHQHTQLLLFTVNIQCLEAKQIGKLQTVICNNNRGWGLVLQCLGAGGAAVAEKNQHHSFTKTSLQCQYKPKINPALPAVPAPVSGSGLKMFFVSKHSDR